MLKKKVGDVFLLLLFILAQMQQHKGFSKEHINAFNSIALLRTLYLKRIDW